MLSPALAFSPSGAAAVVFGVEDSDSPASSVGYVVSRSAHGQLAGPKQVPGAQQVLDVAFDGPTAVLLNGTSPSGMSCCSSAGVVRLSSGGAFREGQTLLRTLSGPAIGQLVPFSGRALAAVATVRGLWVAQSDKSGRFGSVRRLTGPSSSPEAVQAAALPAGGAAVAWTETTPGTHGSGPGSIFTATATQRAAPRRGHLAVRLPGGRRVDELALAAGTPATTIAWTEDSVDRHGNYVSDVAVMDLARHPSIRRFAISHTVSSGLTLAGDAAGDEVLAWKTCDFSGVCAVRAAIRAAKHDFGPPQRLDAVDASAAPVAAVARNGSALLGWLHAGHVVAAALRRGAHGFGHLTVVSHTTFAADLTLAFAPSGAALAVWSQGTLAPEVNGAVYRP